MEAGTPAVKLVWVTPGADGLLVYIARVSNPKGQEANVYPSRLIAHFLESDPPHWSPFEMAAMCLEITTTRDIAHQILRHRSFSFQEFSQRYAEVGRLPPAGMREARLQDKTNRQHSIELVDSDPARAFQVEWETEQMKAVAASQEAYLWALNRGIAKECARVVLPEGLTTTRLYMAGTFRSWLTYCKVRTHTSTQKEHRVLADAAWRIFTEAAPLTCQAAAGAWFTQETTNVHPN